MSVKEAVLAAIKELILPELQVIKHEQAEFKVALALTNKRLDDMNAHLIDQSRRIDDTNKRIDVVHADLIGRIDATIRRIDTIHTDLLDRMDEFAKRMDRLYEVIVRREEHQSLTMRVAPSWSRMWPPSSSARRPESSTSCCFRYFFPSCSSCQNFLAPKKSQVHPQNFTISAILPGRRASSYIEALSLPGSLTIFLLAAGSRYRFFLQSADS